MGMNEVLVFDVDGTLTPPRSPMDEPMARALRRLISARQVFSSPAATAPSSRRRRHATFSKSLPACSAALGNEIWRGRGSSWKCGIFFRRNSIALAAELLEGSAYPVRTGRHIEERTGSLNISVVGRNANLLQRRDYQFVTTASAHERDRLIAAIEAHFPNTSAIAAARSRSTSRRAAGTRPASSRRCAPARPGATVHFFGDTISEGGNDLPLAQALIADGPQHVVNCVKDWRETLAIIERALWRNRPAKRSRLGTRRKFQHQRQPAFAVMRLDEPQPLRAVGGDDPRLLVRQQPRQDHRGRPRQMAGEVTRQHFQRTGEDVRQHQVERAALAETTMVEAGGGDAFDAATATPLILAFCRATCVATGSMSLASTSIGSDLATAMASTPLPVPRSSALK